MRAAKVTLAFVLLLLATAPAAARDGGNKQPRVELNRVEVRKLDIWQQTVDTMVFVDIVNPGPAFKIKDVRYRFKVNDRYVAIGKLDEELRVPESSTHTVGVPLTIDLRAIPGATVSAVAEGFLVRYEVEAEFTVPIFAFLSRRVKTGFKGEMTLGQAMTGLGEKALEKLSGKP